MSAHLLESPCVLWLPHPTGRHLGGPRFRAGGFELMQSRRQIHERPHGWIGEHPFVTALTRARGDDGVNAREKPAEELLVLRRRRGLSQTLFENGQVDGRLLFRRDVLSPTFEHGDLLLPKRAPRCVRESGDATAQRSDLASKPLQERGPERPCKKGVPHRLDLLARNAPLGANRGSAGASFSLHENCRPNATPDARPDSSGHIGGAPFRFVLRAVIRGSDGWNRLRRATR